MTVEISMREFRAPGPPASPAGREGRASREGPPVGAGRAPGQNQEKYQREKMVTVGNAKAEEKMGKNQREKSCKNIREHPRSDEEIRRFLARSENS